MSRDAALPVAVPPFARGGDFTLGAEDELMLLDADGMLTDASERLVPRLRPGSVCDAVASVEIFRCQVEFGTPVLDDAESLAHCLSRARARVVAQGEHPVAVGVHPLAALGDFRVVRSPRYDTVSAEFGGLFRTPTAAFQVHVGLPDAAAMVHAFRGIRNRLALFRALAACSPYWHGRDSHLASARAAIMWSYPRVGVPPAFSSYQEYEARALEQLAAAEAPDYSYLWWDLRPQPRFGTIELRVMDAVADLDLAAGLAALMQGLARYAVENPPCVDLPTAVLRENDFRAARYGLDARITDVDGHVRSLRQLGIEAVREAGSALFSDGTAGPLEAVSAALTARNECDRQRRVVARTGLCGLVADLARRTVTATPLVVTRPTLERR
jgi:carboxylate-amine ligase